ncbi:MAG TPA: hypothetical protein VJQ58_13065 [Burkholderiales bacterium]|nr:hypothetical protein [Burkholderiales bacterium]
MVAVLLGWVFLKPAIGAWAFAGMEFLFLAWLARQVRVIDRAALKARAQAPLEPDEADIVGRYPFYFARTGLARECASTLAALGLASLIAVPWLTYMLVLAPAALIGIQLFLVARLTRLTSPVYSLRMATAKGDRDALRLLSAHDGAMVKLSDHHAPQPPEQRAPER